MLKIEGIPAAVENARKAVAEARAEWERVNKIDTETKCEVLNSHEFYDDDTGKRVTEPDFDFRISSNQFVEYIKLVYARNLEKGIDSGGFDFTFWPIHKAVYDAENALIEAVAADMPNTLDHRVVAEIKASPAIRKQFLKILGL